MKNVTLFILLLFFSKAIPAQTYQVGHTQKTFTDASRSNRPITCEIYYPANVGGENVPIANGMFPVLAFGHGFVMVWSAYDIYWLTLVPQGYIMVFPTTESSFSPSHLNFGKDLAFLCNALKSESNVPASPFFGAVAAQNAVMGHSMGGGAAFLAMNADSTITAMATVAAAITNPSSVTAAESIARPSLVFAGASDCVTPPPAHQLPMYQALASGCKSYVSITGGDHCQFASSNLLCSLGQGTCSPQAAIAASAQQALVIDYLLPWLDFYLKNKCEAGEAFQNLLSTGNGVVAQQNCSLECGASPVVEPTPSMQYVLFPNPAAETVTISCPFFSEKYQFSITSLTGTVMIEGEAAMNKTTVNIQNLPEGIYFFTVNGKVKGKLVKQRQ
jgi:predicted dienelactone hydrolase